MPGSLLTIQDWCEAVNTQQHTRMVSTAIKQPADGAMVWLENLLDTDIFSVCVSTWLPGIDTLSLCCAIDSSLSGARLQSMTTDVTQVSGAVTCRNIHTATEGNGKVLVVTADTGVFREGPTSSWSSGHADNQK